MFIVQVKLRVVPIVYYLSPAGQRRAGSGGTYWTGKSAGKLIL
jgi:hypothetical protein